MFSKESKDTVIEEFLKNVKANVAENCAGMEIGQYMKAGDVDLVCSSVKKVMSNIIISVPDEIDAPRVNMYCSATGGDSDNEISVINITVSNKFSAERKFKFKEVIANRGDVTQEVVDMFQIIFTELIVDEMMSENLNKVNEVLARICKDAQLSYVVKVVSPMQEKGKKIISISDDEVVFAADEDRVFELNNILVFNEPDEEVGITQEMIDKGIEDVVKIFATAQTVPQMIENKGFALVSYVCDISKMVKPMTLLKKVHSKNIERVRGSKDTVGYFMHDDIYAVVAKVEGQYEMVLSPFDTKTFRNVDFDVLSALA